jgi:methyl-accepting chemotaxis protein
VAQTTDDNAAASEQLAASSEELGSQATVLRELIARFRT